MLSPSGTGFLNIMYILVNFLCLCWFVCLANKILKRGGLWIEARWLSDNMTPCPLIFHPPNHLISPQLA